MSFLIQKTEDSAESKTYKKIAEMYKAEVNPNFNFEPEYISDSASYYQKLKILIASNEMPDWFQADPDAFTAELREAGLIYNVGDMLEELGLTDRFLSITLNYPRFSLWHGYWRQHRMVLVSSVHVRGCRRRSSYNLG